MRLHVQRYNVSQHKLAKYASIEEPKRLCKRAELKSLRQICSQVVAEHHEDLVRDTLKVGTWKGVWKHVWEQICLIGYDSFDMFQLFAQTFSQEKDFRCHYVDNSTRRGKMLNSCLLAIKSHRVEFIPFQNGITGTLGGLPLSQLLLLDLSNVGFFSFSQDDVTQFCLSLLSLESLVGLDISGLISHIRMPDHILRLWIAAIKKNNKWCNMRLLCLGGRITDTAALLLDSHLVYIECAQLKADNLFKYGWQCEDELLSKNSKDFCTKYSLAQKYNFIKLRYRDQGKNLLESAKYRRILMEVYASNNNYYIARNGDKNNKNEIARIYCHFKRIGMNALQSSFSSSSNSKQAASITKVKPPAKRKQALVLDKQGRLI